MQKEVAEGMNHLVPQSVWNGEGAAVNHGSGWSSHNVANVTRRAMNLIEQCRSSHSARCGCVARRRLCRPHEFGESLDILAIIFGIGDLIIVCDGVPHGCSFRTMLVMAPPFKCRREASGPTNGSIFLARLVVVEWVQERTLTNKPRISVAGSSIPSI